MTGNGTKGTVQSHNFQMLLLVQSEAKNCSTTVASFVKHEMPHTLITYHAPPLFG